MAAILILEDEETWLGRHNLRLTQAGFKCYCTSLAKEALEIAKDPSVRFALIDEILYVPPVPVEESKREYQRLNGSDVIREIARLRSDMQFVIVTSAPRLSSHGDLDVFSRETAKLRRLTGVIDVVHKHAIDNDPNLEYGWLIHLLKKNSQITDPGKSAMSRVLIGIDIPDVIFQHFREQFREQHRREYRSSRIPLRSFLKELGVDEAKLGATVKKCLVDLESKVIDRKIFIEMPGSKQLADTRIKPYTSAFKILMLLAQRAEQGEEVVVSEKDYTYSPRKSSDEQLIDPNRHLQEIQDYTYGYDNSGRKQLRHGVQIEKVPQKRSPLKTEISRLRTKLADLNVAPARQVFPEGTEGRYAPAFEMGIFLYSGKKKKR